MSNFFVGHVLDFDRIHRGNFGFSAEFSNTGKVGGNYGWRDSCAVGGVMELGVAVAVWFGFLPM